MNLLIVNDELNSGHSSFGWQETVVRKLAPHVSRINVLTSKVGAFEKPANVDVELIPPKPFGISRKYGGGFFLNPKVFSLLRAKKIDAVFIHMNTGWAYRLFPAFRARGVPVIVWHEHAQVGLPYHLAVRCATRVVSGSREGAGTRSEKLRVIGHAVDMATFAIPETRSLTNLLSISRIAPVKRIEIMLAALSHLAKRGTPLPFEIVGSPLGASDESYARGLRDLIAREGLGDVVHFRGLVTKPNLRPYYERAFLTLNLSLTNSLDASVIESLASGCPVLTSSPSFFGMLAKYPELIARDLRSEALGEQIREIHTRRHEYDPHALRALVQDHDLVTYPQRLLSVIQSCLR